MCADLKVRSKVVKYITGYHYCVNSQAEKQSISCHKLETCTKQRELFSTCWFYNLGGEGRLVGRMCFGLTGKWYTVISELQPRVFLSTPLFKPRCSKRKTSQDRGLFTIIRSRFFFLSWFYFRKFDSLATFIIHVMRGSRASSFQVAWIWIWPAHWKLHICNFNSFSRHKNTSFNKLAPITFVCFREALLHLW